MNTHAYVGIWNYDCKMELLTSILDVQSGAASLLVGRSTRSSALRLPLLAAALAAMVMHPLPVRRRFTADGPAAALQLMTAATDALQMLTAICLHGATRQLQRLAGKYQDACCRAEAAEP